MASRVMLVGGSLKFAERVLAHKRGSMNELRRSIVKEDCFAAVSDISEIARMIDDTIQRQRQGEIGNLELGINIADIGAHEEDQNNHPVASSDANVRALCKAYHSFNKHKDLYAEVRSSEDCYRMRWPRGRITFDVRNAGNAFNSIKLELSFAYDHFYTKMAFLHTWWGWFVRVTSLVSVVGALLLFYFGVETHDEVGRAGNFDKRVTDLLLSMAFFLEAGSLTESILSKRCLVQIGIRQGKYWRLSEKAIVKIRRAIPWIILNLQGRTITQDQNPTLQIGQFSLLPFCFNDSKQNALLRWFLGYFDLKQFWNNFHYVNRISIEDVHGHQPVDRRFLNLVFDSIAQRLRNDVEQARRDDHYFRFQSPIRAAVSVNAPIFQASIARDLEEFVIVWHIATDMCYNRLHNLEGSHYIQYAKYLSDYMLYLLQAQPAMLSPLTTKELLSYQNACTAINKFYYDNTEINGQVITETVNKIEPTYEKIQRVYPTRDGRPWANSNLLLEGYELAREIQNTLRYIQPGTAEASEVGQDQELEIMSRKLFEVWVDIVTYTAVHVPGKQHAEHLITGGEFITYIWLFIIYLTEL